METFVQLLLGSALMLGPLLFFIFYADSIFGYGKFVSIAYVVGMATGFFIWKPLLLMTLVISWALIVISWGMILWGIVFYKNE